METNTKSEAIRRLVVFVVVSLVAVYSHYEWLRVILEQSSAFPSIQQPEGARVVFFLSASAGVLGVFGALADEFDLSWHIIVLMLVSAALATVGWMLTDAKIF